MYLQKIFHLSIFMLISFILTACSIDNQLLENRKKIYEKEPISENLINEINQIVLDK